MSEEIYSYRVYRSGQHIATFRERDGAVRWITDQISLGRAMWDDYEILDGSDA